MLTATTPGPGLGIYDLVVTNPGGLERALTTGKRLYLPLIVSGR